jgi:pimeloyl-ACP methyl ester carboxylesterase
MKRKTSSFCFPVLACLTVYSMTMEAMAGPCGYFASPFPDQIEIHTSTPVFNWIYVPAAGEREVTLYHIHLSKFPSEGMPPDIYCCFPECSMRGIDVYSSSYALPYSERLLESGKYWWVVWARHDPTDPYDWECVSPIYWFTVTAPEVSFLDKEDLRREVVGADADGVSAVVIQISGLPEDITPDDIQISILGGDIDGSLENDNKVSNGVFTQTYIVPACFVRNGHPEDLTAQEKEIGLSIIVKGEQIDHKPFNLVRPPVVLLHGLWGSPSDMNDLQNALRANGYQFVRAEQYPNQASFAQNAWVPQTHVRHALDAAINQGLVAKKADVVAYSMGGCIAKLYGHSSYIRRIVTIGTPHYGSPWADTLFSLDQSGIIKVENILKSMNPPRSLAGAVHDLQTGANGRHVDGSSLHVPTLAIAGIYPQRDSLPSINLVFGQWLQIMAQITGNVSTLYTNLFGNDDSDWIVSKTSQEGGLSSVASVVGPWHIEEPTNSEVIGDVTAFLDAPSDEISTALNSQFISAIEPQYAEFQSTAHPMQSMASTAGTITITAPEAGTVYLPGATMHVSVNTSAAATKVLVALSDSPFVVDDTPPFEMDVPIPQQSLGAQTIIVLAWDTNGAIEFATTTVNVMTSATVTALKIWPDSGLYLVAGETVPFVVHGVFSDGVERDITTSQCGTAYATTDSSVATIDSNGVLTAKARGCCFVIVSNGVSMQIPVLVQTSAIIGDFNGDGKVDFSDFAFLANQWQGEPSYPSADIAPPSYGDGVVDYLDLAEFTQHWLEGTLLVENFESGNFNSYPWQQSGNANWVIVSDTVYEGNYAAKSGTITDNQSSTIEVVTDTYSFNAISFARKVSSEANYDYLRFYIDGVERSQWSGNRDWAQQICSITPGQHTFKWSYTKDGSVSSGSDCAWIDDIVIFWCDDCPPEPVCGDGICEPGEEGWCPDCAMGCNFNGICDPWEGPDCPDCAMGCNFNGMCDPWEGPDCPDCPM